MSTDLEDVSIFWSRVDIRGHDACRLEQRDAGWNLSGAAVYVEDEIVTCLTYHICHDADWITQSAQISGWSGTKSLSFEIIREANGIWSINGAPVNSVKACIDLDLGFTPATNTTAIRRLQLDVGERQQGTAAWLDTADWQLKPLEQYYQRRSDSNYEYGSPAHNFHSLLTTNESGFVTQYPKLWHCDQ